MYLGRAYFVQQTADPTTAAALGLAASYSLVLAGLWFPVYIWFCMRTAGIRLRAVLAPLLPALAAALLMGLAVWLLGQLPQIRSLSPNLRLGLLVTSGVAVYVFLAMRELRWCWHELAGGSTRAEVSEQRAAADQAVEPPGT